MLKSSKPVLLNSSITRAVIMGNYKKAEELLDRGDTIPGNFLSDAISFKKLEPVMWGISKNACVWCGYETLFMEDWPSLEEQNMAKTIFMSYLKNKKSTGNLDKMSFLACLQQDNKEQIEPLLKLLTEKSFKIIDKELLIEIKDLILDSKITLKNIIFSQEHLGIFNEKEKNRCLEVEKEMKEYDKVYDKFYKELNEDEQKEVATCKNILISSAQYVPTVKDIAVTSWSRKTKLKK